jgi:SAM-dependent methyltransferase
MDHAQGAATSALSADDKQGGEARGAGSRCAVDEDGGAASQFGHPRGLTGRLALWAMGWKNGPYNYAARDALLLAPGDRVLEIGCGPGVSLRKAARKVGRSGFVAGADISTEAVQTARHKLHWFMARGCAQVERASVESLPFPAQHFDKSYAVNSFQFWPQPKQALREIARVLAPGGRLVIVQRSAGPDTTSNFAGAQDGWTRIEQAVAAAKQAGFSVVDVSQEPAGKLVAAVAVFERPLLPDGSPGQPA